jgi:hypothetical protein
MSRLSSECEPLSEAIESGSPPMVSRACPDRVGCLGSSAGLLGLNPRAGCPESVGTGAWRREVATPTVGGACPGVWGYLPWLSGMPAAALGDGCLKDEGCLPSPRVSTASVTASAVFGIRGVCRSVGEPAALPIRLKACLVEPCGLSRCRSPATPLLGVGPLSCPDTGSP